jgi:DNA repair exonuclease SbcCD ATPase subunit
MPTIEWLEIEGFRSFAEPQRLEFTGGLVLVWGANSQGKTSIAEAIEFLFTGATVRRELLGGAKAEFDGCLRNAHLAASARVAVRAGIRDADGDLHEVERVLVRDYTADADCESTLTVAGAGADDLSALGIVLADPPLRAPVLLQHSLRFALSARPQDRSNYFKAVLEIQDLEVLRDLIEASGETLQTSPAPTVAKLRALRTSERFRDFAAKIEAVKPAEIAATVSTVLGTTLADLGATVGDEAGLAERVATLAAALDSSRESSFPSSAYTVASTPPEAVEAADLPATAAFNAAVGLVDAETARLTKLFEAVLAVPKVGEASDAVECPVCETPDALTPVRIATMRAQVANTADLRQAEAKARTELTALLRRVQATAQTGQENVPGVASVDEATLRAHQAAATALLGESELHVSLRPLAEAVKAAATALSETATTVEEAIQTALTAIAEAKRIDTAEIIATVADLERDRQKLAAGSSSFAEAATAFLAPIKEAVDRKQGTDDLRVLAELADDVDGLRSGLVAERARVQVRRELERALRELDKAKAAVFDEKFEAMSAEIDLWWRLLRPDEPVRFASVRRRGTGRRFVMFKAHLLGAPGLAAIERDALGVFSDSQLNALGLAAFLARASLQDTPLVVIDDPVQAGDEEHRATFVGYVLEKLLERGMQVIVLTYDDMLSKLIHHRYEAHGVVGFSVTLDRPAEGSVVTRTTNTAEMLLQRAKAYLEHDDPEFRASASGHLRRAAERIAKEIIINARQAKGEVCSLADYEDKTLGPLVTELTPYLLKADHPGKWKVVGDLLNPGSHDDAPPGKQDLKMAFGYLREALRHYLRTPAAAAAVAAVEA